MKRRVRVLVSGRVQGVWFRESTRQAAEAQGVTGWVCNLPDGRVEALLEGETKAVEAVIAFLHQGPSHARVDDVEVMEEPADEGSSRFRIR